MAWETAISALGVGEPTWRAAFRVDGADKFRLKGEASVPITLCETTSGGTHTREMTQADICPEGGMPGAR